MQLTLSPRYAKVTLMISHSTNQRNTTAAFGFGLVLLVGVVVVTTVAAGAEHGLI